MVPPGVRPCVTGAAMSDLPVAGRSLGGIGETAAGRQGFERAMRCLYASDYGAPTTGFDPGAAAAAAFGGAYAAAHRRDFATAQNAFALQAVKRQIDRGEAIVWCEPGYGWTHEAPAEIFMSVVAAVAVPLFVMRLARRFGARAAPWRRPFHPE